MCTIKRCVHVPGEAPFSEILGDCWLGQNSKRLLARPALRAMTRMGTQRKDDAWNLMYNNNKLPLVNKPSRVDL